MVYQVKIAGRLNKKIFKTELLEAMLEGAGDGFTYADDGENWLILWSN